VEPEIEEREPEKTVPLPLKHVDRLVPEDGVIEPIEPSEHVIPERHRHVLSRKDEAGEPGLIVHLHHRSPKRRAMIAVGTIAPIAR
jgi:hypothetical protein